MGESPLGPEETLELAELRRRAYGAGRGIADDADAQSRLAELERVAKPAKPDTASDAAPEVAPDPITRESPQAAAAPVAVPTAPIVASTPPRQRRRQWILVAAIAVAAALVGSTLTAFALSSRADQRADAASATSTPTSIVPPTSLAAPTGGVILAPNPDLTGKNLYAATEWAASAGVDVDTLQSYQDVGDVTPWTGTLGDGSAECILLMTNDGGRRFSHVACDATGGMPSLAIVETPEHPLYVGVPLPVGAVVLFTDSLDGIELRISHP